VYNHWPVLSTGAKPKRRYDAIENGVADFADPLQKDGIAELKVIRDQARAVSDRAEDAVDRLRLSVAQTRGRSRRRLLRFGTDRGRSRNPSTIHPDRPASRSRAMSVARTTRDGSQLDGKGIGTGLLKHALERCVAAAELVGGRALMVNAVDEAAAAFWRRRGFIASKDDPFILFCSIADIAASLSEAARSEK
jgi:hypothetical protein